MHVMWQRFHRIRYYGLFANRTREKNVEHCRALLGVLPAKPDPEGDGDGDQEAEAWEEQLQRLTGIDPSLCPACKEGRLVYLKKLVRQPARFSAPEPLGRAPP